MEKRVFLIHGWEGRPDNHWFPWLTWELRAQGFEVFAPHMPNAARPQISEWLNFLKEYVGTPDGNTFFVGHSLGCLAVARYLEALPSNSSFPARFAEASGVAQEGSTPSEAGGILKSSVSKTQPPSFKKGGIRIGGCVFVAGFSKRLDIPEIASFFLVPFDPEKAKARCNSFACIFSDNDRFVPMDVALTFARELGARTVLERGKGHFSASDGVKALPSALSSLLKMSAGTVH